MFTHTYSILLYQPAVLYVLMTTLQVRDDGHRIAREAAVVEADAQGVRSDAEDLTDLVQMAVQAANG